MPPLDPNGFWTLVVNDLDDLNDLDGFEECWSGVRGGVHVHRKVWKSSVAIGRVVLFSGAVSPHVGG